MRVTREDWVSLSHLPLPRWAGLGLQGPWASVGVCVGVKEGIGRCWREEKLSKEGQGSHCGKMRSWMKQMKQKTNRAQAT